MLIEISLATASIAALMLYGGSVRRIVARLGAGRSDEARSWGEGHAVRVFGVAIVMTILAPVVAVAAARALGMAESGARLGVLVQAFVYAFNAATLWLVFRFAGSEGSAAKALGFKAAPLPRSIKQGLGLFVLFIPFQVAAPFLLERLWVDLLRMAPSSQKAIEMLVTADMPVKISMAFMAVVAAPFYEEIIFRGFIQQGIERAYGRGAAIMATSLLFAAIHFQGNSLLVVLQILPVSVAFSVFYDRTRNITSNMLFHALFNLSAIVAVFVARYAGLDLTV